MSLWGLTLPDYGPLLRNEVGDPAFLLDVLRQARVPQDIDRFTESGWLGIPFADIALLAMCVAEPDALSVMVAREATLAPHGNLMEAAFARADLPMDVRGVFSLGWLEHLDRCRSHREEAALRQAAARLGQPWRPTMAMGSLLGGLSKALVRRQLLLTDAVRVWRDAHAVALVDRWRQSVASEGVGSLVALLSAMDPLATDAILAVAARVARETDAWHRRALAAHPNAGPETLGVLSADLTAAPDTRHGGALRGAAARPDAWTDPVGGPKLGESTTAAELAGLLRLTAGDALPALVRAIGHQHGLLLLRAIALPAAREHVLAHCTHEDLHQALSAGFTAGGTMLWDLAQDLVTRMAPPREPNPLPGPTEAHETPSAGHPARRRIG